MIRQWANVYLGAIAPSGSFAKGSANKSGTDIDLFISLLLNTKETLRVIYDSLSTRLTEVGYRPKPQNVPLGIKVNGYSVDLVPGKQQGLLTEDHSIFRRKAGTGRRPTWPRISPTSDREAGCSRAGS